ncbi:MAG: response regulator [Actinomycetota bacterium]
MQRDERILATVLFTDIVDSTRIASELGDAAWRDLLDSHDATIRRLIDEHDGDAIKSTGDGFLATFERPAQGLACATAAVTEILKLGIQLRAGVHTGEVERRGDDIGGIGVHVAARIASLAGESEVLASSTVRDLAAGAGYRFVSRGATALKGLKGKFRLFVVEAPTEKKARASAAAKRGASTRARPKPAKGGLLALVVDDHPLWRKTIASVLTTDGVARQIIEAGNGDEAVKLSRERSPDVVVMDMELPKRHGIEATKAIVNDRPDARILILSSSDEPEQVLAALRAGALGYLLKTAETEEIVEAVRRVHAGEAVVPAALAGVVLGQLRDSDKTQKVRTLVAASSLLDREGLAHLMESAGCEVMGRLASASELKDALDHIEVLVVETVELTDWIEAVSSQRNARKIGLLVISQRVDPNAVGELLSLGSEGIGYLLKGSVANVSELTTAVRRVAAGEAVLDPEIVRGAVRPKSSDPIGDLTEREREVLSLVAEGHSNQSIAEKLFLSAKRVEGLVGSVFTKLGLEDAPESNRRVLAAVTWLRSGS